MARGEKSSTNSNPKRREQQQQLRKGGGGGGGGGLGGGGRRRPRGPPGGGAGRDDGDGGAFRGTSSSSSKKLRLMDLSYRRRGGKGIDDEDIASDDDDDDKNDNGAGAPPARGNRHQALLDKESNEEEGTDDDGMDKEEEEEDDEEPLDVKKVRLARQYLEKLDSHPSDSSSSSKASDEQDDDDNDDDIVGRKLQRDRLKREGTLERALADRLSQQLQLLYNNISTGSHHQQEQEQQQTTTISSYDAGSVRQQQQQWTEAGYLHLLKGHDLTPTCAAMEPTGQRAVSGSKDHSVILWDIEHACRVSYICRHWKDQAKATMGSTLSKHPADRTLGQVLAVAISDDGRYTAVGSRDGLVRIFDVRTSPNGSKSSGSSNNLVKAFVGHKAAVTALAFRTQSLQLFSGSDDRCVKQYNLDDMLHMETLYGHQFGVTAIDCYRRERPISVGRDRTARAWKIADDTHLIFRGGARLYSAESVAVIKDDWFLTGHEDGHLALWMTERKRAVATVEHAHGVDATNAGAASTGLGRPVVSVAALKVSDVAATGSHDGYVRFWKVRTGDRHDERGLEPLLWPSGIGSGSAIGVPLEGYINAIAIGPKAKFCIAAVGQEHRLGRWDRIPNAKNRLAVVKLCSTVTEEDNHDKPDDDLVDDHNESQRA